MLKSTTPSFLAAFLAYTLSSFSSSPSLQNPTQIRHSQQVAFASSLKSTPPNPPAETLLHQCTSTPPNHSPKTSKLLLSLIHAAQHGNPSFHPQIAAFDPNPNLPPHHPCNAYTLPSLPHPNNPAPLIAFSSQLENIHPDAAAFALALEIAAAMFEPPPPSPYSPLPKDITQSSIQRLHTLDTNASLILLAANINPFDAAKVYFLQTLGHPAIHNPLVDIDDRLYNIASLIPL